MKLLLFLSMFAATISMAAPSAPAAAPASCGETDVHWFACATDADCMVGENSCGMPMAHAKTHAKEFEAYQTCRKTAADCAPDLPPVANGVRCFHKLCKLK